MAAPVDADFRTRLQVWLPKLVLSPSLAMALVFVYGFILFTVYLSFTDSRILPSFGWVGLENYVKLFRLRHWEIAVTNMGVFAVPCMLACTSIGRAAFREGPVAIERSLRLRRRPAVSEKPRAVPEAS